MATMRAIRYHGNRDIRLDTVPVAPVGPDHVKIAPEWCGLCGSGLDFLNFTHLDLHEYLEGPKHSRIGPHPLTGEDLPRVFGHEFAGLTSLQYR
jgi:threonine dehydrogenase-like Zn-dependent dehydrogenase